jgi:hypothetical protein
VAVGLERMRSFNIRESAEIFHTSMPQFLLHPFRAFISFLRFILFLYRSMWQQAAVISWCFFFLPEKTVDRLSTESVVCVQVKLGAGESCWPANHPNQWNKIRNILVIVCWKKRPSDDVVGWGTALQSGRSRVRFLPAAVWPSGRLSLWLKSVPGVFPGGKGGRCPDLATLPPSCTECFELQGASTYWNTKDTSRPL